MQQERYNENSKSIRKGTGSSEDIEKKNLFGGLWRFLPEKKFRGSNHRSGKIVQSKIFV